MHADLSDVKIVLQRYGIVWPLGARGGPNAAPLRTMSSPPRVEVARSTMPAATAIAQGIREVKHVTAGLGWLVHSLQMLRCSKEETPMKHKLSGRQGGNQIDISRTAKSLIGRYGSDAELVATRWADCAARAGNRDRAVAWRQIVDTVAQRNTVKRKTNHARGSLASRACAA